MIFEKEAIDAVGMLAKVVLPKSSKSTDHHVGTSLGVTGDASLLKVHDGENVVSRDMHIYHFLRFFDLLHRSYIHDTPNKLF